MLIIFEKLKVIFSNHSSQILTASIVFISIMFYQFGYSFIYGYYFIDDIQTLNIMDIIFSQIPFDFNFIAITGGVVFVISSLFIGTLWIYIGAENINKKIICILSFVIEVVFLSFIVTIFNSTQNVLYAYDSFVMIGLIFILLFFSIKSLFSIASYQVYYFIKMLISIVLALICLFLLYTEINNDLLSVAIKMSIIVIIGIIDSLTLNVYINFQKYKFVYLISYSMPVIFMFLIHNLIIYIVISLLILFSIAYEVKKIKRNKLIYMLSILCFNASFMGKKPIANQRKSTQKGIYKILVISITPLYVIIFFLIINTSMSLIGNSLSNIFHLNSENMITFYNPEKNGNDNIIGIVVAQKNDNIYVSSNNHKMTIITSPFILITSFSYLEYVNTIFEQINIGMTIDEANVIMEQKHTIYVSDINSVLCVIPKNNSMYNDNKIFEKLQNNEILVLIQIRLSDEMIIDKYCAYFYEKNVIYKYDGETCLKINNFENLINELYK